MTSSVFFKFKSQREPTRVEFDGTGISVFELKREIINKSGLGDGTDFDLFIYSDDNSEEYDDDTTIIPRSTTVIARRQPALKPGAGRAARYVSGKMPVTAKNAGRKEQAAKASAVKSGTNAINQMNNAMTEEERMAAMFAAQTEQWSAQQEELSHQTPVFKAGAKRPANVPDHDPPNGYICYRCGNKGHWIQLCPTNDDPEFDNRPRVKRTTGIPRSFLQKVDKSVVLAQTDGDETKRPSGIMVNAEGDFVIAEPDKASWEQFQAKAKTSSTDKDASTEDKEIQERGLECSLDKKLFIEPMKTPCCQKTFCNDCITNALIESDFVCPACQTEGVLIDDLVADEEAAKKIQDYLKEKEAPKSPSPKAEEPEKKEDNKVEEPQEQAEEAKEKTSEDQETADSQGSSATKEKSKSPTTQPATTVSPPSGPKALIASQNAPKSSSATSPTGDNSRKRPADEMMENPKIPKGPRAMQNQQQRMMSNGMNPMGMPNMDMGSMMFANNMPNMPMMPNMMGMGMGMPMMGMPGMMGMPPFGMNGWDMSGMGGMNPMNGMGGMPGMNDMNMGMNMGSMNGGMNGGMNPGMGGGANGGMPGAGMNNGPNGVPGAPTGPMNGFQNRHNFSQPGNEEDAYFRKPVNPHRHQNRQRRVRPSDYREL